MNLVMSTRKHFWVVWWTVPVECHRCTQCFPQWCVKKSWSGVNPDQQLWFENKATCPEFCFSHSFLPFYDMLKGSRMQEHSLYLILPRLRLLITKEKKFDCHQHILTKHYSLIKILAQKFNVVKLFYWIKSFIYIQAAPALRKYFSGEFPGLI